MAQLLKVLRGPPPHLIHQAPNPVSLVKGPYPSMTIPSLILLTALAMLVHEFGHLVAARDCRVSATELGLGFGPKILAFTIGSIRFSLRILPLGSFVRLDGSALKERPLRQQLNVHLGGVAFNLVAALISYGSVFCWINLLIAAGNVLPVYQHDGWKCGRAILRAVMRRNSQSAEWALTFSGGFLSLLIAVAVIRIFV